GSHSRLAAPRDIPRYSMRYAAVFSSGATYPVNPPTSAVMLVIVARSSTDSDATASPQYSTSLPIALPLFTYGWRRISSMKSLAVTLSGLFPRTTTRTVSGTVIRTSFVIQELKMAVVPTPNATQPTAPACGVCESLPMITMPGAAYPSRILEWQIASEP